MKYNDVCVCLYGHDIVREIITIIITTITIVLVRSGTPLEENAVRRGPVEFVFVFFDFALSRTGCGTS